MSLPRYERYLSSGADWLGSIPEHWSAKRVKIIFEIRKRIAGDLGHDVLSVTQKGLKVRDIDSNDGQLSMDYSKYQFVEPGDFVMNHMDLLTGYVDVSKIHGVTSPDYRVFTARRKDISSNFFLYLFQNGYRQRIFYAFGQGASGLGRWRMPTDSFNDFVLPVPPLSEQSAIATFLDRETGKIDTLVLKQQQLIKLLKEKRQAMISRAVTKGLDPNVPTKKSGVEWLGEVPEHWTVSVIKRCLRSADYGISDALQPDGGIAVLRMGNIQDGEVVLDDLKFVNEVDPTLLLERDDLLYNRTNSLDLIGKVGRFVPASDEPVTFASYLVRLRPNERCLSAFLAYALNTNGILGAARARAFVAIGQCNLNPTRYGELEVAVPPRSEQEAIVSFLDAEIGGMKGLQDNAEAAIALLNERRAALISAAVTGKIDVRGLVEVNAPISDVVAA
jgi:type I restriction enzyme, S subunit